MTLGEKPRHRPTREEDQEIREAALDRTIESSPLRAILHLRFRTRVKLVHVRLQELFGRRRGHVSVVGNQSRSELNVRLWGVHLW